MEKVVEPWVTMSIYKVTRTLRGVQTLYVEAKSATEAKIKLDTDDFNTDIADAEFEIKNYFKASSAVKISQEEEKYINEIYKLNER